MTATFTQVHHPADPLYQIRRQEQIDKLLQMNTTQLDRLLKHNMAQPGPIDESGETTRNIIRDLSHGANIPATVKGILDTTNGTTGNALIRQDLEPIMYALFLKSFPVFEKLRKDQANGLVHTATQITSPENGYSLGGTVISELGSISYGASQFARVTFPIAVFATGRGVSLKEIAAVSAGGAPYDATKTEMSNAMTRLAQDMQYYILQGNASNAGGLSTQEQGLYNANGFDGLRGVLGSVGTFSGNGAVPVDIASYNITETLQAVAAKASNVGGNPTMAFMSMNAKQALDIENSGNQRYNNDMVEIIPGVRVTKIPWANGELLIVPVPGNTIGSYTRVSDSATVEDIYVIDEATITMRWLYSESWNVIQIPTAVDGMLSDRFVVFGMYGMEQAAPLFNGKARRVVTNFL